jgi:hypothetical protein
VKNKHTTHTIPYIQIFVECQVLWVDLITPFGIRVSFLNACEHLVLNSIRRDCYCLDVADLLPIGLPTLVDWVL